jgi:uncharacterized protein (DUF302 family)
MTNGLSYGLKKQVPGSVDEVEARVQQALADEGFGVLTKIDVAATLKAKLDVDFRPYRILGACNPSLAHSALSEEDDIGLLLPCNVVVYEADEGDGSIVSILDPVKQLAVAGRSDLGGLASEVRARMERVIEGI